MQLGWDARMMTGDERFFFGVVEFETCDQRLRNLSETPLQLIVSHSASHGVVLATSDMNRHANEHTFHGVREWSSSSDEAAASQVLRGIQTTHL